MFDLAWTEMLVIAVITILVVGPKDLPKVMRGIGNIMGKAKSFSAKFRGDIDALARETEMDDLRKQARAYQDRFRQQQMALEQDFLDPTTGARRSAAKPAAPATPSAAPGDSASPQAAPVPDPKPATATPASVAPTPADAPAVNERPAPASDTPGGESGNGQA